MVERGIEQKSVQLPSALQTEKRSTPAIDPVCPLVLPSETGDIDKTVEKMEGREVGFVENLVQPPYLLRLVTGPAELAHHPFDEFSVEVARARHFDPAVVFHGPKDEPGMDDDQ